MTAIDTAHPQAARPGASPWLAAPGRWFSAYLERLSKAGEVKRLHGMTDRQLADMGIKREDIPRHVYRAYFHI